MYIYIYVCLYSYSYIYRVRRVQDATAEEINRSYTIAVDTAGVAMKTSSSVETIKGTEAKTYIESPDISYNEWLIQGV
jgi:hypothetical protein